MFAMSTHASLGQSDDFAAIASFCYFVISVGPSAKFYGCFWAVDFVVLIVVNDVYMILIRVLI